MFGRLLSGLAIFANVVMILVLAFFLVTQANRTEEFLILVLCLLPPLLALVSIFQLPDWEERKLTRQVNKARLKRELQELEGK